MQRQHEHGAASNRAFLASENHGRPAIAATARPGEFHGHEIAAARSGDAHDRRVENRPVSHVDNRPVSHRFENRPESHQTNSPHDNIARPVARQEMHGTRAAQPEHGNPPPENHHGSQPSAYHPESARPHQNAPQHDTHSGGGHDQKRH